MDRAAVTPALQVGLGVVMFLVTLMQLSVLVGFKTGKFASTADAGLAEVRRELELSRLETARRFDDASKESSKLASIVQGLIGTIEERVASEHAKRRAAVDALNVNLGKVQIDQARQDVRLSNVEKICERREHPREGGA